MTSEIVGPGVLDVADLRARVRQTAQNFLAMQTELLADVSTDCTPLVRYVADLMDGGKRLRPAFCYWAWRAVGGADGPGIVTAATSLEFLQAAALIHDDVMDASDTRRGAPSVHRRFAALHHGNGWARDGDQFGVSAAILAGDLCLTWSDELYTGSALPAAALTRGRTVFNSMRTQLIGGQYLDLLEQAIGGRRPEDALQRSRRVMHYKSAKYTVEHPLLLGARLAGAGEDLLTRLSRFGLSLGEAFQLRDDVLGVFGDPARTGKPAGDDLREGKRTVLIALARQHGTAAQRRVVDTLFTGPPPGPTEISALREIIVDTGALAGVESMITELLERSVSALASAALDETARAVLLTLANAATARTS
jgi:geranylgeranyl diphosphate synthase type I